MTMRPQTEPVWVAAMAVDALAIRSDADDGPMPARNTHSD